MRNVVFQRAGSENFCCFKDPIELPFENNKIVLVTGPNGVGKTTLFDIIPYTSYGVTSKGLKGDDVVNDEVGKNCHTWYEVLDGADKYKVERYVKHSKFGNTVLLHKNGILTKKGHTEVLPEIERIIGPQKLFMNILLFGQKVKTFFTDLNDTDQKDIFRKVMQLEIYVLWYNETNEFLKKIATKLEELGLKISVKLGVQEQIKNSIEKLLVEKEKFYKQKEEIIDSLQENLQNISKLLQAVKVKIGVSVSLNRAEEEERGVNDEILTCKHKVEEVTNSLNSIIEGVKNQKKALESDYQKESQKEKSKLSQERDSQLMKVNEELSNIIKTLREDLNSVDKKTNNQENEIKVLETKKESIEKEVLSLGDVGKKKAICPTCKQQINLQVAEELEKHREEIKAEIEGINNKIQELTKEILPNKNQLKILKGKIFVREQELQVFKEDIKRNFKVKDKQITDELTMKLTDLSNLESKKIGDIKKKSNEQTEEFRRKESELIELQKDLKDGIQRLKDLIEERKKLENDITVSKSLLKQKEEEKFNETMLQDFLKRKDELREELKELKEEEIVLREEEEIDTFWKGGFSSTGIPSILIDEAIPFMNATISDYLEKVGGRYIVSFDTQAETKEGEFRDKIAVRTLDTKTKANSRKKLSSGQTRVVDIATILTLCDLQSSIQDVKYNILLFDEIFDSLDDENIGYISNLLRTLLKDKSIYIISHRQIDQIEADETLKFF